MTIVVAPDYGYAFIKASPGKVSSFVDGDPTWTDVTCSPVSGCSINDGVIRRTARVAVIEIAGMESGGRLRVAAGSDPTMRAMVISGAPGAIQLDSYHSVRWADGHAPLAQWMPQALSVTRPVADVRVNDNLVCEFTFQAGLGNPAVSWVSNDLLFQSHDGQIRPYASVYSGMGTRLQQSHPRMGLPGCGLLLEALRVNFGDYIVGQAPSNMEAMTRSALHKWVQQVNLSWVMLFNGRAAPAAGSNLWVTPLGDGVERNYWSSNDLRERFASSWNVLGIAHASGPLQDQVHAPGSVWLVVDGGNAGDTIQVKKGT